jgi:cephalosporin hydroxylase
VTWLEHFDTTYYRRLMPASSGVKRGLVEGHIQRGDGFRLMFDLLIQRRASGHSIIETGTLRNPGNWKDGQSAVLFADFVSQHRGHLRSVDIDPTACDRARLALDTPRVEVFCSDSVSWLAQQQDLDTVDLFYLDSWDVHWEDDTASAEHHLREFHAIEPYLQAGCVVAIDDNSRRLRDSARTGKGRRIVEYLHTKGIQPIMDAYQIIYQWP